MKIKFFGWRRAKMFRMQSFFVFIVFMALSVLMLFLAVESWATVISVDLNNLGDGLLTLDSETGLSWLDLTTTTGKTFTEIANLLASGGTTSGTGASGGIGATATLIANEFSSDTPPAQRFLRYGVNLV